VILEDEKPLVQKIELQFSKLNYKAQMAPKAATSQPKDDKDSEQGELVPF